jgi:hypothetical protein
VGVDGTVLKTTDGGTNWSSQTIGRIQLNSVYFTDKNTGWAVGVDGIILNTTNGGIDWTFQTYGADYLSSIYFTDKNTGWIVGDYGTILKTTNGGITFVAGDNNAIQPNGFILHQNYPNPFNPSTKIEFTIPKSSLVNLTVYNVLGEEIETLVNETKASGNYEVNFNSVNLPSGIYFYKLQAGSFAQTKKMILMK